MSPKKVFSIVIFFILINKFLNVGIMNHNDDWTIFKIFYFNKDVDWLTI